MAEHGKNPEDDITEGATPPGRGEQTHDVMRRGALRTIHGPGASEFVTATGGLELPGTRADRGEGSERDLDAAAAAEKRTPDTGPAHEPIPGERDPTNLT